MSRQLLTKLVPEAETTLRKLVGVMHDKADDAFFDQSEKVPENGPAFFSAMKIVREARNKIELDFVGGISTLFNESLSPKAEEEGGFEFDLESLSLVESDEVDERVLVDSLVGKARREFAPGITALLRRCNHLLKGEGVEWDEKTNPFDPENVIESFNKASKSLEIESLPSIFYFKMFDRHVVSNLDVFYDALNAILVDEGILPELGKPKRRAMPSSTSASGRTEEEDDPNASFGSRELVPNAEGSSDLMKELIGVLRDNAVAAATNTQALAPLPQIPQGALPVVQDGQAMVDGVPLAGNVQVTVLKTEDLMGLLSQIQTNNNFEPSNEAEEIVYEAVAERVDVRESITEVTVQEEESGSAIEQENSDLINLVSLLFDFILDDDTLPEAIKALLARLQIPYIKVAIADNTFFDDDEHPAKLLLNLLADVGAEFDLADSAGKSLYLKIKQIVGKILDDFEADIALFSDLLQDFQGFADQLKRRQAALQKRLRDIEEGRAKQQAAEQAVTGFLAERIGNKKIPTVAVHLLNAFWRKVLIYTHIHHGNESDEWALKTKVVDILLWCLRTPKDEATAGKQKQMQPKLMVSLKKAATQVGYDPLELEGQLGQLQDEFKKIAEGSEAEKVPVITKVVEKPSGSDGQSSSQLETRDDGVLILNTHKEEEEETVDASEISDETWEQLDQLSVEARCEITMEDGVRRAKLAAYIRSLNKYIFVNAQGAKVVELKRSDLAMKIQNGEFKQVDQGSIFNRALAAVIEDTRSHPPSNGSGDGS